MSTVQGNLFVTGLLQPTQFSPPPICITDAAVATPAAGQMGIATSKTNHRQDFQYNQDEGAAVVSATRIVGIVQGTSAVAKAFYAALKVACLTTATITVDLKKNGASVLSAPISFGNADAAMTQKSATITTTAAAAGDIFEVVVTATASGGTLGQGLAAFATIDQTPT